MTTGLGNSGLSGFSSLHKTFQINLEGIKLLILSPPVKLICFIRKLISN